MDKMNKIASRQHAMSRSRNASLEDNAFCAREGMQRQDWKQDLDTRR